MIKELAKSMNVTESDLMCLVTSVCESIKQDKFVEGYLSLSDEDQAEACLAYVQHAVRKIQEFHTAYITKPELKQTFDSYVYELIKSK